MITRVVEIKTKPGKAKELCRKLHSDVLGILQSHPGFVDEIVLIADHDADQVLAIEAIAAAQALDFLAPLKPGKRAQQAMAAIRAVCPPLEHDRSLAGDFARVAEVLKRGDLAAVLR